MSDRSLVSSGVGVAGATSSGWHFCIVNDREGDDEDEAMLSI